LFAAPGGFSQGFREAGFHILGQVDNDKWGCETLYHNFGPDGTIIIQGDIERILVRAKANVVIGGPPCQSFSHVGRPKINHLRRTSNRGRFIDQKRNRLYKHFVRIVETVRPQFFVMENVPGMISFNEGVVKDQVLEDFTKIGYDVDVRSLKAANYGVPQIRKRAIFIGNSIGVDNPFPAITHFEHSNGQVMLGSTDEPPRYVTVFDAISDLPLVEPGGGEDEANYPQTNQLTPYQNWARLGSSKLFNHVARRQSERDRRTFRLLQPGQKMADLPEYARPPYRSDIFADKIRKQSWHFPSRSIMAHMQKDGLMYVHPDDDQARTFTPREAARIQSFPDRFRFKGPMTWQFRQIGNAVPPLMAQAIAEAIKPLLEPIEPSSFGYRVMTPELIS
jgi:DNA (cytosine-5)-methyltransferase 1